MKPSELDGIIRKCLFSISDEIAPDDWRGREREIVSRFCFGYLIHSYDPDRIGMEVAVPQLRKPVLRKCNPKVKRPRKDVSKDVVIWPRPKTAVFDSNWKPCQQPLAVMEWTVINHSDDKSAKKKKETKYEQDQCWLRRKSKPKSMAGFVGYAVFVDTTSNPKQLKCARVSTGEVCSEWLILSASQPSIPAL